jgi:hypothetical protein
MAPTFSATTGFAVCVPPNWFEVDLHPATRQGSINTLVAQRVKEVPELFAHRSDIVRTLRGAARTAHDNGAVYCAVLADGLDGGLLTANVTVSIVTAPGDAHAIADHLRPMQRRAENGPWRVVEQVELPHVGRVTRTRGVEDITMPEGTGWVRSALLQTFIPLPGPGPARVALITGASPILPLTAELHDLLDAITATFRFVSSVD